MAAVREPEHALGGKAGSWREANSPLFINLGAVFLERVMIGDVEERGLNQKSLEKSCAQLFQASALLVSVIRS